MRGGYQIVQNFPSFLAREFFPWRLLKGTPDCQKLYACELISKLTMSDYIVVFVSDE